MNRACPVVLRRNNTTLELLAFRHPAGGNQLVKGKFNHGESLEDACIRELAEESGIQARAVRQLGVWDARFKDQVWGFCLMHFDGALPDNWEFVTTDEGGQLFRFFWQPLNSSFDDDWPDVYIRAVQYIKQALGR